MRVLINSEEHFLQQLLQRWGHEVLLARTGVEVLLRLQQENPPKIAILSCEMDGIRGVEVCARLRELVKEPYIYLVLLTSQAQKDELIEGLECGADDYVIKPFDAYELRARLLVAKRFLDLQDQLISMRDELRVQATQDSLTGLWNRGAIIAALERELQRSDREGCSLGVILADLDYFKAINDTYGHLAGDAVLKEAAKRMRSVVRPYDLIGRYGGEEFLVVSPGTDETAAYGLADRLRRCISEHTISLRQEEVLVTMSLGSLAVLNGGSADSAAILQAVDEALFRAKRGGRNRVERAKNSFSGCPC